MIVAGDKAEKMIKAYTRVGLYKARLSYTRISESFSSMQVNI